MFSTVFRPLVATNGRKGQKNGSRKILKSSGTVILVRLRPMLQGQRVCHGKRNRLSRLINV